MTDTNKLLRAHAFVQAAFESLSSAEILLVAAQSDPQDDTRVARIIAHLYNVIVDASVASETLCPLALPDSWREQIAEITQ